MKRNATKLDEKETIREKMLFQLKRQSVENRIRKSNRIKELALDTRFFKRASSIMLYISTRQEVDTKELIQETLRLGKTAVLPRVDPEAREIVPVVIKNLDSLVKSPLGIWEPELEDKNIIQVSDLELVFVPGIAFNKWGNRLGRGLGFYDRFLSRLPSKTVKVGLAFDFQIVDQLPVVEGQDVSLDLVISN